MTDRQAHSGKPRIVVIDDDADLRETVLLSLEIRLPGVRVSASSDARSGLEAVRRERPDLVILDLGLPDADGLTVCADLRRESDTPIIILTARDRDSDVVKGLNAGADDYITKPFSPDQLIARVQAVLRRAGARQTASVFKDAGLTVDLRSGEVGLNSVPVRLSPSEYRLLTHFVQNAGRLISQQELSEAAWGTEYADASGYLAAHVQALQEKIGPGADGQPRIVADRGVGFRYRVASAE